MSNVVSKTGSRGVGPRLGIALPVVLLLCVAAAAWAQADPDGPMVVTPDQPPAAPLDVSASPASEGTGAPTDAATPGPQDYGLWVLAPPVVAIVLAVLLRQAVPALFIGILVGGYMIVPYRAGPGIGTIGQLEGLRVAMDVYVLQAMADFKHIQVMVFTLLIGGAVGVMGASGGTRGLVNAVSRFASTSRRGQFTGWLAGLVVFFDDYANCMIVGPTMRPIFDRLRISRAKLSYIVDSTAAPVASVALIGTWLGAELGFIGEGLNIVASRGTPDFLAGSSPMHVFLASLPYRFYPLFALWMVLIIALTGRDFGPMRKAEARTLAEPHENSVPKPLGGSSKGGGSAWLAVLPILILVGVTLTILYQTGVASLPKDGSWKWSDLLRGADANLSILYGGLASLAVAAMLAFVVRSCSMRDAFDGMLDGMARMFPAIVILVLAWALSQVSQDLHLGEVLKARLVDVRVAPAWLPEWTHPTIDVWLPLSVFICAAGVSFATGTSWTTMGILTPAVVQIAAELAGAMPPEQATSFFYAAVGSVLAGAIFGDHCSPISDTTVLSAVASRCRVEEHVWTQLPYAVVVAVVAMAAGNVYCMHQNKAPWWGLGIGAAVLLIIVFLFGRQPKFPPVAPELPPGRLEERTSGS